MKKILFFAMMAVIFVACNQNAPNTPNDGTWICYTDPEPQSQKHSGNIVGTIGCFDENDNRTLENIRKGVVIRTNSGDSLLSFTLNIEEFDLQIQYGTYSIGAIAIPYEFYYKEITPSDNRYVHIRPIVEDAMHLPCNIPNVQVDIISAK